MKKSIFSIRRKQKKAHLLVPGTVIFIIAALIFTFTLDYKLTHQSPLQVIGKVQSDIVGQYADAEVMKNYIDLSAAASLRSALVGLSGSGGIAGASDCGSHVYNIVANREKNCLEDPASASGFVFSGSLVSIFSDILDMKISRGGVPFSSYSYNMQVFDRGDSVEIIALPTSKINLGKRNPILIFSGDFMWPTQLPAVITSCYGARDLGDKSHDGVDVGRTKGPEVYAPMDGEVVDVCYEWTGDCACSSADSDSDCNQKCRQGCDKPEIRAKNCRCSNYGNYVVLKHDDFLYTKFSHLDTIRAATKGQKVAKGEIIATIGNTGFSTGPHLDFKVFIDDSYKLFKDTGKNPFCFFTDAQLLELKLSPSGNCADIFSFSGSSFQLTKSDPVLLRDCADIPLEASEVLPAGENPDPSASAGGGSPSPDNTQTPQTPPDPASTQTTSSTPPTAPAADPKPTCKIVEPVVCGINADFTQIKTPSELSMGYTYESANPVFKKNIQELDCDAKYLDMAHAHVKGEVSREVILGIMRVESKWADDKVRTDATPDGIYGLFQMSADACKDADRKHPECDFDEIKAGDIEMQYKSGAAYISVVQDEVKRFGVSKNNPSFYYFVALGYNAGPGFAQKLIKHMKDTKKIDPANLQWNDVEYTDISAVGDDIGGVFATEDKKREILRNPNQVMYGIAQYCGYTSSSSVSYEQSAITFEFEPSFRVSTEFNFDVFEKINAFAAIIKENCKNDYETDDASIEACVARQLFNFNQQEFSVTNRNPDIIIEQGTCEDDYLYPFMELYYDCLNSDSEDCICEITEDDIKGLSGSNIVFDVRYLSVSKNGFEVLSNAVPGVVLQQFTPDFNPALFKERPDSPDFKTLDKRSLFLDTTNSILHPTTLPAYFYKPAFKDINEGLVVLLEKDRSKIQKNDCNAPKTQFTFCALTKNYLPQESDDGKSYSYDSTKIKFAVDLKRIFYEFEDLKVLSKDTLLYFTWKYPDHSNVSAFNFYFAMLPFNKDDDELFANRIKSGSIREFTFLPEQTDEAHKDEDLVVQCLDERFISNPACAPTFASLATLMQNKIYKYKNSFLLITSPLFSSDGSIANSYALTTTSKRGIRLPFSTDVTAQNYWGVAEQSP